MSKFKVGDKVRCVDARAVFKDKALVEGDIYTVEGHDENDYGCISLCERDGYFYEDRFELVEELAKEPVKIPEPNISIKIERVGDTVSLKVDGQLTWQQVGKIVDVLYDEPNLKKLRAEQYNNLMRSLV